MKKQFSFFLIVFMLLGVSQATFAQSSVKFRIKNAGFTVYGSFKDFNLDVNYNASNPSKSTFDGTVQVKSINTNNNKRDKHLRNEDFFHASKWSIMKFRSTAVKKVSSNKLKVTGKLTIKDVTKTVTFDVNMSSKGGKKVFDTSLLINRRDYGVGGYSIVLANNLYIDLHVVK